MSGYLSNLLTNTTTRYNSLRRTILSDEADGDTEDDSHISRVLRAYYAEKGRPLPPWLPPDPKKAMGQSSGSFTSSVSSVWQSNQAQPTASTSQSRATLSDLWDPAPQQQAGTAQPTSLRRQAQTRGMQQQGRNDGMQPPPHSNPLPSQRAGSYQTAQPQTSQRFMNEPSPPSSSGSAGGGGGTAQERLKARLWAAARQSSSSSVNSQSSAPSSSQGGSSNPYESQQQQYQPARAAYPSTGSASAGADPYDQGGGGGGYSGRSARDRLGQPNGPRRL